MNQQETYWAKNDAYHKRNDGRVEQNRAFFRPIMNALNGQVHSVMEFGSGTGDNLAAIHKLQAHANLYGVEINEYAAKKSPVGSIFHCSIFDFVPRQQYDLVLTKGFLIHIAPENLPTVLEKMYQSTRKYVMVAEYFSPHHEMIEYRGDADRMWRGDFAGMLMDRYKDLQFVASGFASKRDDRAAQDDLTWVVLEKV